MWKSLLKLRHLAERFIKSKIGNGANTRFWYDNWTPLGPLLKLLGDSGPRSQRIPVNASVASACNNQGWILAPPRTDAAVSLHMYLSSIPLPSVSDSEDGFDWYVEGKPCGGFSTQMTWDVVRPRDSPKDWASQVWFKGSTPRHAFNMWIAHLDRLPTLTRLASWGLHVNPTCSLCSASPEIRDHLFIDCAFTASIWDLICNRLGYLHQPFSNWSGLMRWSKHRSETAPKVLRLLLVQALVYTVWRQRNNLIHNLQRIPPQTLFKDINRQIINSITARGHMKRFKNLMPLWLR
ncbi:uncharacterized protein LOC111829597 [Capsella rubella]|uniref:uncharacterized protein LOC111829597 n=1 Tax=Capsella rubella TaxID=81985 RepID=UPI000CD55AF6|nr:uncharacterized protein LOC111829597 [Capsella rubella]